VSKWKAVQLSELVTQIDRAEPVQADRKYRLLGVRLEGNGAFHRETVSGVDTSAGRLTRVEEGDFIYSRLFAWRGAFGVIGKDLCGCFVSNEFPLFRVDRSRLDVNFLNRWFQLPSTWKRVEEDCTGSTPTTRNRFKEGFFLKLEVPLPPLSEQQAIVEMLDALSERTGMLSTCLNAFDMDADALVLSLHHKLAGDRKVALSEIIELYEEPVAIEGGSLYPQVGVRSFGLGLFSKPALAVGETTYRYFNRLYEGAFVLSQVKGWEGAIALTSPEFVGMYASPEYRTFRCIPGKVLPDYLIQIIRSPWFWELLQDATRGVGARRERTRPEKFLNVVLPMPEYGRQIELMDVFRKISDIKDRNSVIHESSGRVVLGALQELFAL